MVRCPLPKEDTTMTRFGVRWLGAACGGLVGQGLCSSLTY